MAILAIERTKRYVRLRVKHPGNFIRGSLRTHDIGRGMHSKRIAGRLKRTGKWDTQAFLITRGDWNTPRGQELYRQIRQRYG